MTSPVLPVIRTLGGCGGTLVSRLFGALPKAIVLSETNPRSASLFRGHLNPLAQLRRWRPALLEDVADLDDAEIGYPPRFGQMLQGIWTAAERYGYALIVRDFNYVDFIGVPFIWPPTADCSLNAAIEGRFDTREFILVRHPADQLASLRTHKAIEGVLTAERFADGCARFIEDRAAAPRFRYEDLAADPEVVFRAMCGALGLAFDPQVLTTFSDVSAVTGHHARNSEISITAPARSDASRRANDELSALPGYGDLLGRLGYGSDGYPTP